MRYDSTAETALHVALLLAYAPPDTGIAANRLAEFHDLSPGAVAKVLQKLTAAEILRSVSGRAGGYQLARAPKLITVLDVVEALEGVSPDFHCREIRMRGVCRGVKAPHSAKCLIASLMGQAAAAWRETLRAVTLAELAREVEDDLDPRLIEASSDWLGQHVRPVGS